MDVRLPNGVLIKGVPDNISQDEVKQVAISNGLAKESDFPSGAPQGRAEIPIDPNLKGPPQTTPIQNPTALDYALMGAAAVPAMAGASRVLQFLARGSKAAPYASRAAEVLIPKTGTQLAYEGALGAVSGVAGGKAAEQAPEQWQKDLIGAGVGAAVAAPFSVARNLADVFFSKSAGGTLLETGARAASEYGAATASKQAATAIKANPTLVPTVLRANEIEQQTGISLPMLAASNGDTTISSFLQSQIAKGENAEFAASLKAQYEAAEQALAKAKRGQAPSMQEVDTYVKRKAVEVQTANAKSAADVAAASKRRQEGLENINIRLGEIASEIKAPGNLEVGARLDNLLKAKEATIRKEVSPKYEELLDASTKAGIVLPGTSAQGLRDFATDEMNSDVFAKFPSLYGAIKREFYTPPKVGSRLSEKYTIAKESSAPPKDIPLRSLDSLKREVNKAIRDTNDKDQLRKLYLLKGEVDAAIDTVDPAFSVPYRAIDEEYAIRLGIPFNKQGVINIDRAKFTEDTVPKMTQNASSLKDVLAIVGDSPEGMKIVEDAFLFELSNNKGIISTTTGEINPKQLQRWMSQNKEKLSLVPGLKEKLENVASSTKTFLDNRTAIREAEKAAQQTKVENLWSTAYGTSDGIRGLVRKALSTPQELDKLLSVTSKDKVANEAVKAAVMDDILSAQGDRVELFTSNKKALEKIFGVPQTKQLSYIVEASQRLKDNPFTLRINLSKIDKTAYEELLGTRPEQTAGELRNTIISAPRVFINHLSRYFQNRASKAEASEMQKFLLNPKNLQNAALFASEIETKGVTDKALALAKQMAKNSSGAYLFGALTGAGAAEMTPATIQSTIDPALLEGFGVPEDTGALTSGFNR